MKYVATYVKISFTTHIDTCEMFSIKRKCKRKINMMGTKIIIAVQVVELIKEDWPYSITVRI